ncbi:stage II sporulation protein D [Marinithermofilum abyssi]|uniref:Stage II sporulation protein D n=1 Tax=Marinithermofilum abyssi TaxID=1571185 RepID=A0A8J2YA30_9BACL|nr:stage II sporulation protein D [Marinithermofilum abyssi]GGE05100.1 stage II sporulation protein D [Marinithermofilum abyssi]
MHKGLVMAATVLISIMMAVPALLVSFQADAPDKKPARKEVSGIQDYPDHPKVKVYLTKEKRTEEIPLELYIRGVVAAEMPHDFQLEALKAQAMAARTYIVDRLAKGSFSDMAKMGPEAKGAQVSDTVVHQVYATPKQLKKEWGKDYKKNLARVDRAVRETQGKVILYQGKPIYAAFFSTSNGYTENSEDYFRQKYPYLRSVPSPWDQASPKFNATKTLTVSRFIQVLERYTGKQVAVATTAGSKWLQITRRTSGSRVAQVKVGDEQFTGRQIREALQLASTDFTLSQNKGRLTIHTKGSGHGVGMSQWGANLMAKQGKSWQEILHHYYKGVEFGDMDQVLK